MREDIEKLREKLYKLIKEQSDYSEILKVSQDLDKYIAIFTSKVMESKNKDKESRVQLTCTKR